MSRDPLLDASPGADEAELARAFRRAARRHHPDTCPGDPDAAARFVALRKAYEEALREVRERAAAREQRGRAAARTGESWRAGVRSVHKAAPLPEVEVPLALALAGAEIAVPRPDGCPEIVRIPAETGHGAVLRVTAADGTDLRFVVRLRLPEGYWREGDVLCTRLAPGHHRLPELGVSLTVPPGRTSEFEGGGLPAPHGIGDRGRLRIHPV